MSRKSRNRVSIKPRSGGKNAVSLFPFLAVLLCTMGALIMLLVVIARNVREQADQPAAALEVVAQIEDRPTVEEAEELIRQIEENNEEAAWFAENFSASKSVADRDLVEARAALASAETQAQKFKDELARLEKLAEQLEKSSPNNNLDQEYLKKILEQRRQQQKDLQAVLEKLQKEAEKEAKSYAIIPYRGRGGTFRRPIYIECFKDRVVIQPEGIVLTIEDFELADRPDNPLDAAMRVVRQYYTETKQIERGTEPYPLIIVRPSGVEAYTAARRAIGSWANEFGYELVDEDWKIEYPTPSAELKDRMERQVATSRSRMQGYRAAMRAQQIGEAMSKQYRVDSKGMVQEIETPNGIGRGGMSGRGRSAAGSDPTGGRIRHADRRSPETASAGNNGNNNNGVLDPNVSLVPRSDGNGGGIGPGGSSSGLADFEESMPESLREELRRQRAGHASTTQMRSASPNVHAGQPIPTNQSGPPGAVNQVAPAAVPYASVYSPEQTAGNQLNQLNNGWQAQTPQAGSLQNTPTPDSAPNGPQAGQTSTPNQAAPQTPHWMVQPTPTANGMPALGLTATTTPEMHSAPPSEQQQPAPSTTRQNKTCKTPSIADRPNNWALRNVEPFSAAVKRNVKIRCEMDKFVLLQQPGLMGVRVVPITDSVVGSTDRLVQHLWDYMESWGLAGEKYFWQPVLQIEVAPGSKQRFEELRWLLRNSGLVIEKVETNQRRR